MLLYYVCICKLYYDNQIGIMHAALGYLPLVPLSGEFGGEVIGSVSNLHDQAFTSTLLQWILWNFIFCFCYFWYHALLAHRKAEFVIYEHFMHFPLPIVCLCCSSYICCWNLCHESAHLGIYWIYIRVSKMYLQSLVKFSSMYNQYLLYCCWPVGTWTSGEFIENFILL